MRSSMRGETAVTLREPHLTPYERARADVLDPIRVKERGDHVCSDPTAPSISRACMPRALSDADFRLVDDMMGAMPFVEEASEKIQIRNWIAQYLADDPRHNTAMYWPLPFMNLHAHVNGMLPSPKFLSDVKDAIKGHEAAFWKECHKRYTTFLRTLDKPLSGEDFEYVFDDHYKHDLAKTVPELIPHDATAEQIEALSTRNLEKLAGTLSLATPIGEDSCSVSYNHAYDIRGVIRDAVEAVVTDKGHALVRKTMLGIAKSLAKQRVGSVDMQVSKSFLQRPDSAELLAACNAHGIHVNYLAYEISRQRLHLGIFTQADEAALRAALENPTCTGIDFCGAEFPFSDKGMEVLERILLIMREISENSGRVLTLRPHVGEGFKADKATLSPKEVGAQNIEKTVDFVEHFYRKYGRLPLVEIRFGHATHTTATQAARMANLGIVVESNPHSNEITGVATREELGRLHFQTHGVNSLFGTDGEGVMVGNMQDVESVEEAILWAFRNGFADKEVDLLKGELDKITFTDLVYHRAREIAYKNHREEPSDQDRAQATRELWNTYDMSRVKGLAENRRLQMGWMMSAGGEMPKPAERSRLLKEAIEATKLGEWDKLNHFLKCVFFFRGCQPRVQNPTGVPTAFYPTTGLSSKITETALRNAQVHPFKVQPYVREPEAAPKVEKPKLVQPEGVAGFLLSAVRSACDAISKIQAPDLESLRAVKGQPSMSVEAAFANATARLTATFTRVLGNRIVVGPNRRACIDGWTMVLNDKEIVGVQLMPVNAKGTKELSHYQHIGAGARPVQLGDNAARFFARNLPEMLVQRGGEKNLLTGPTGKPLVCFGPADLTNDPKRVSLYIAVATQSPDAEIGGKYTRTDAAHKVLVEKENGDVVSVNQEREAPKGWESVSLDKLRAFIKEREAHPDPKKRLAGHGIDLKYLMEHIDAAPSRSFDDLIDQLQLGVLVPDPKRDVNPKQRPLERVSIKGQNLLADYFAQTAKAIEEALSPLEAESKANFKVVRDFFEKGDGGEFRGLGELLKEKFGLEMNVSDAPFVRVQFQDGAVHWVGFGRSLLSYAPSLEEGLKWRLESISVDDSKNALLLRYWEAPAAK